MFAAALVVAALAPAPCWAGKGRNLLSNGGLERRAAGWETVGGAAVLAAPPAARSGRFGLLVRHGGGEGFGASAAVPPQVLQDRRFLSRVTGALRGTFSLSLWLKAGARTSGSRARVQLNEYGGGTSEEVMRRGKATVALGATWKRVVIQATPRRPDRTGIRALVAIDGAPSRATFALDDVRLVGNPLGTVTIPPRRRWHWWAYALVWTAVLGSGAAVLAAPRLRAKTARRRVA